jgi:hypothetical protein
LLDSDLDQPQATAQLETLIEQLVIDDPLCINAHGNNQEIGGSNQGDDTWVWSYQTLAGIFKTKNSGYKGKILVRACGEDEAQHVANFSSALAVELGKRRALKNVWIYGQITETEINRTFLPPGKLGVNAVEFQGTQVNY